MDLIERNLPRPANIVFNRYLMQTRRDEDLDALAALPFFLSLRAAIRAKVIAVRLKQADPSKWDDIARTARAYFAAACRLIAPPAPVLIAVSGLSGTGKSVLARSLSPEFLPAPGAVVLRSDVERKVMHGIGEMERLPREAYGLATNAEVYRRLTDKARRVIRAGHSAVVDAVFAHPDERAAIAAVAKDGGVRFHGLFLTANLDTRKTRVASRERDASDADTEIAQIQERYDLGRLDWAVINASGAPEDTHERAKAAIAAT
jgi:predicted kinase